MSKRKFKKGKLVTSIDELFEHQNFIVQYGGFTSPERTVHFGFVQSWQVSMANLFVRGKRVWVAERLTNGEFYSNMTDKEIVDKFDEGLCAYCPLPEDRRGVHNFGGQPWYCAESGSCKEALEAWKEAPVE